MLPCAVVTNFTIVGPVEFTLVAVLVLRLAPVPAIVRGCEVTMTNFCCPVPVGVFGVRGVWGPDVKKEVELGLMEDDAPNGCWMTNCCGALPYIIKIQNKM